MDILFKSSEISKIIAHDIEENMVNHAYMLISGDGECLKGLSKHIAKQILCESHSACGQCSQCVKIEKNEHADVVVLPSSKKNIVVEDVENIVNESYVLPLEGEKKIYILNDFDLATVQAQNKLLKTLEEPPKSVVFVVTASNENNVLATIRSRCKKLFVPQIKREILRDYLMKKYNNSPNVDRIMDIVDGNLSMATKFLENDKMLKIKDICISIVNAFDKSDKVLSVGNQIQEIDDFENFLGVLLDTFREVMEAIVNNDGSKYKIQKYSAEMIVGIVNIIQNSVKKYKANCNINAIIDYLLLGILEVRFKCSK